ncbi:sirohydrochlorin chelatase [Pseudanabaena yagii]|uniref:Sirohydrochlorin chelatase n=1 Tax=Pseudanabaena yagii GIHE-NHR1 TaxID=2722753 RepID=A0ABX1LQD6_9CYAN|nr:CbiX/SirB N-terminal domain-containing protein [Pseudanabaena yagii]NMF57553.1 sirohydrochlorin chelatase [Pseudanabaena yagii GIHE-NHR1]
MNATALFFVTHGSSDRRSWSALQDLVTVARSHSNLYISGGCLEGQPLTLAQQLEKFANEITDYGVSTIAILPLLLLEGIHVSEDIPHEVAIAQSKLQNQITLRILSHLGTHSQIPDLLAKQFEKYADQHSPAKQARILVSHGSRRAVANQVVENLAKSSQAIAAYWGIEPKVETQIEHLIAQGIERINVLPYFLTEGGITEAIANKLKPYSDRAQIRQLPVPLSNEQLVNLALSMI